MEAKPTLWIKLEAKITCWNIIIYKTITTKSQSIQIRILYISQTFELICENSGRSNLFCTNMLSSLWTGQEGHNMMNLNNPENTLCRLSSSSRTSHDKWFSLEFSRTLGVHWSCTQESKKVTFRCNLHLSRTPGRSRSWCFGSQSLALLEKSYIQSWRGTIGTKAVMLRDLASALLLTAEHHQPKNHTSNRKHKENPNGFEVGKSEPNKESDRER